MRSPSIRKNRGVVFCDLDETLYPGLTLKDTARWFLHHGYLKKRFYAQMLWWLFLHKLGKLDYVGAFKAGVTIFEDWEVNELRTVVLKSYKDAIKPKFRPEVLKLIKEWRKERPVVIATASLEAITRPIAEDLGIHDVIGTELAIKNGVLTGKLKGPVLVGKAKATAIRAWAKKHKIDLGASVAVGGRMDDLELLKLTGQAVVVNPDAPTRKRALREGWQIVDAA